MISRLHLIKFDYDYITSVYRCHIPVIYIKDDFDSKYEKEFLDMIINKLREEKSFNNFDCIFIEEGSSENIKNSFLTFLDAPNPKIQYLNYLTRTFSDKTYFKELDDEYYTKVEEKELIFYIRIFDKKTQNDTDDEVLLPLLLTEKML